MKFVKTALILMFLLACNLALSAAIPAAERQALIDLYNSTNGASWTTKTNWLGAEGTENTWYGVTTDAGIWPGNRYASSSRLIGRIPTAYYFRRLLESRFPLDRQQVACALSYPLSPTQLGEEPKI